ncbi:two-component regulator - sensor kinase [Mycolicibacterium aurum]|uniref:histidine kinase n=1 Tax=Mycolicibacterium aurum TaxID=1791 RepID=A0A3S4TRJ0_MYCAU|nr:HAMP domain-containing sensor histidine kinase [Mycolicibacterium aurum]VEG51088.1 two-component regulator - sensor kinase [Mycolicibacterium aurum]
MTTATPSLRRRVVVVVLGLLIVLLALLGITVDTVVGAQARRDLNDRLMATAARADSLAEQGVPAAQLVTEVGGGGIRARVITSDGTAYGDPAVVPGPGPGPPGPPPPPRPDGRPPRGPDGGPPGRPPTPPPPPDATATTIDHRLPTGDRLILVADTTATTALLRQLRIIIVVSAVAVLLVAAAGLTLLMRAAMAPLDRLAAVAESITSGNRGRRVHPDRPRTELGRAAVAFDGMLDALETSEQRARAAAAQAEHAEAATRQFLADAAHELRTPIAGIHAGAQQISAAAMQDLDDPGAAAQRRRAELVLGEARRAGRLVADMLDLSRIDAGVRLERQDCDLVELAEAERRRIAVLSPTLTAVVTGDSHVPLRVDPVRVQQILANLGDNARRHTPDAGVIELDVRRRGDTAVLTVTDTGAGVPDDQRERIFARLVRLDDARTRDGGGAGLGLPIARALARAHGGDLTCEAHTPGARFTLVLPLGP